MKRTAFFITALIVLVSCKQEKTTVENIPNPKETNGGYVSNPDKIISDFSVEQINEQLSSLDNEGKAQVAVVLLNSIGSEVPKDFAVSLFNHWKIGSKENDNGVLILVIKDQHRVEFETGYGIEGDLPDIICARIGRDYMLPDFELGDYDNALIKGVNAVEDYLYTQKYSHDKFSSRDSLQGNGFMDGHKIKSNKKTLPSWGVALVFFILYIIITLIVTIGDSRKEIKEGNNYFTLFKNKLTHSYLFELLFLLFVPVLLMAIYYIFYKHIPLYIPLVTGYLAWCVYAHLHYLILIPIKVMKLPKGEPYHKYVALAEAYRNLKGFVFVFPLPFLLLFRWWHLFRLKKLRNTPYTCECGTSMTKLDENDDDKFLSSVEILEEQLKSIDYDVWVCMKCHHHLILQYENYHSAASHCSACSRKTLELTQREVIRQATKHMAGFGYNHFKCRNCNSEHKIEFTIPKKSSSGEGNSSSGSGSNWGGGSSGGGGAGSSW